MRTQLVDFQGLASVEAVVSRLLLCYPLAVVSVCSVVVNVKFMVCMYEMQGKEEKGRREGVVFFFVLIALLGALFGAGYFLWGCGVPH